MKKVKAFFKKIGKYIHETAWIQPLLIVVVIFVILFSLSPLTNAIQKGWTALTTTNKMEKITYGEYVEKVNAQATSDSDEGLIFVFTQKGCDICPKFYKGMNEYLKSEAYKSATFKIYNVDLTVSSKKKNFDGVKCYRYKDATAGYKSSAYKDSLDVDYVKKLDNRIGDFVNVMGGSYTEITSISSENDPYSYVSTPLIMWYQNGVETRISNTFKSCSFLEWEANEKKPKVLSFKNYIQDFGGDTTNTTKAEDWNEKFNLDYAK